MVEAILLSEIKDSKLQRHGYSSTPVFPKNPSETLIETVRFFFYPPNHTSSHVLIMILRDHVPLGDEIGILHFESNPLIIRSVRWSISYGHVTKSDLDKIVQFLVAMRIVPKLLLKRRKRDSRSGRLRRVGFKHEAVEMLGIDG